MPKVSELMVGNLGNAIANIKQWGGVIYNPKAYKAKGNGSADDYEEFETMIDAIGTKEATVMIADGTYRIGSDLIFPANVHVWFLNGGMLAPDSGKTITFNGGMSADPYQIFSGQGSFVWYAAQAYPHWWGAVGDGVVNDTVPFQKAALSGKEIIIPNGDYVITGALDFAFETKFSCLNKPVFKIKADTSVFKLGQNNHITGGCTIDLSGVVPFTKDIFEISSATVEGKTAFTFLKLGIKVYDIDVITGNDGNLIQGSVFNVWSSDETEEGTHYTCHGLWDIDIQNINVRNGWIGYFYRNWSYRKNDLVADGWLTGVRISNVLIYGAQYVMFGSKSIDTMSNTKYYDTTSIFVSDVIVEYTSKSELVLFATDRGKTFKNFFTWDFPALDKPYVLLYRAAITNAKIYFDGDSREIEDFFDVWDFPATQVQREKITYIKKNLSHYTVKNANMNTDYRTFGTGLGGGLTFPYYFLIAEFTDTNQKNSTFMINMGYNASYDRGTVIVTLRKADTDPTNPAVQPTLGVHTAPYVSPARFASFSISKSVTAGVPKYRIYMSLPSNTFGAGAYYRSLHGDGTTGFPIELVAVADPSGVETLNAATDFGIVNYPQRTSHPGTAVAGFAYFNTVTNSIWWYDGTTWKTSKDGTASIASGTTSIVVAHGLGTTPTGVQATPRGNVGNVWISSVGATNFTINCSAAPGANTTVTWNVSI